MDDGHRARPNTVDQLAEDGAVAQRLRQVLAERDLQPRFQRLSKRHREPAATPFPPQKTKDNTIPAHLAELRGVGAFLVGRAHGGAGFAPAHLADEGQTCGRRKLRHRRPALAELAAWVYSALTCGSDAAAGRRAEKEAVGFLVGRGGRRRRSLWKRFLLLLWYMAERFWKKRISLRLLFPPFCHFHKHRNIKQGSPNDGPRGGYGPPPPFAWPPLNNTRDALSFSFFLSLSMWPRGLRLVHAWNLTFYSTSLPKKKQQKKTILDTPVKKKNKNGKMAK